MSDDTGDVAFELNATTVKSCQLCCCAMHGLIRASLGRNISDEIWALSHYQVILLKLHQRNVCTMAWCICLRLSRAGLRCGGNNACHVVDILYNDPPRSIVSLGATDERMEKKSPLVPSNSGRGEI